MKAKRSQFIANIDRQILEDFKTYCQEQRVPMNRVVEIFMNGYAQGRFKVAIEYDKLFEKIAQKEYNNDKLLSKIKNGRKLPVK